MTLHNVRVQPSGCVCGTTFAGLQFACRGGPAKSRWSQFVCDVSQADCHPCRKRNRTEPANDGSVFIFWFAKSGIREYFYDIPWTLLQEARDEAYKRIRAESLWIPLPAALKHLVVRYTFTLA
jgi:hypothetical protein